jgi:hypothetical protein
MSRLAAASVCAATLVALAVPAGILADPPLASEYSHTCDTVETSVHLSDRVEIKCSPHWSNPSTNAAVNSFAVASSSALAAQVVEVALAGQTHSRKVRVRFKTSAASNPAGCGGDCRKLVSITLLN